MTNEWTVMWGDLHRQTDLTCGEGNYRDHFKVAQRQGLDFLAVTDNATLTEDPRLRQFVGSRLSEHPHFYPALEVHSISRDAWNDLRDFVRQVEGQPPIFLLGYEWCSNRYGDRNVYYLDDGPLQLPSEVAALHKTLRQHGALAVLHHSGYARGRRGADWNHHDGYSERLVEIFSTQHGSSEGLGDKHPLHSRSMGGLTSEGSVLHALSRRYKLGFTSGTDLHRLDQEPGKTGAIVTRPTKEALWEALWQRRTIATSGPRFDFRFNVDGHAIGTILTTDRLPELTARLPHDGWQEAQLVRNGEIITSWQKTEQGDGYLLYQEQAGGLLPDNYYYLRVHLEDGHLAWSSPVWVSLLPDTPPFRDILYWLPEERCVLWGRHRGGELELEIQNGYVAGAAAGGLRAPDDVTLEDLSVDVLSPEGDVTHTLRLGPLEEGERQQIRLSVKSKKQRVRLSFRDPFANRRIIERGAWLNGSEMPPFLRGLHPH